MACWMRSSDLGAPRSRRRPRRLSRELDGTLRIDRPGTGSWRWPPPASPRAAVQRTTKKGRAVTCALGISVTCALWVTCALGIKNLGHLRTYLLPSNGWCLLHMQLVNGLGWGWGGGGLQLPTIQRDSELLKRLPSWTRSTSLHTHTHTHSPFDCLSKHTSAIQTHLRAQTIMSGLGWGMGGWGGGVCSCQPYKFKVTLKC